MSYYHDKRAFQFYSYFYIFGIKIAILVLEQGYCYSYRNIAVVSYKVIVLLISVKLNLLHSTVILEL